jgi:hypothetical protein
MDTVHADSCFAAVRRLAFGLLIQSRRCTFSNHTAFGAVPTQIWQIPPPSRSVVYWDQHHYDVREARFSVQPGTTTATPRGTMEKRAHMWDHVRSYQLWQRESLDAFRRSRHMWRRYVTF